jgi:hypothetical protein
MLRRRLTTIAAAGVVAALLVPMSQPAQAQPTEEALAAGVAAQLAAGIQVAPKAGKPQPGVPNPFVANYPSPMTDFTYWNNVAEQQGAAREQRRMNKLIKAAAAPPFIHDEQEPAGVFGANDTHASAELVNGFGTKKNQNNRVRILGQISPETVTVATLAPAAEDDGSIPLAGDPGITATRRGARITSEIGNGPHGSAGTDSGDFDFLRITATAGQMLTLDTDTPTSNLDTVVAVYDSAGVRLASNDDSGGTFDSFLQFPIPATGTYFVMVSGFGFGTVFPVDPFDSGSGLGAGSEGAYDLTITAAFGDRDLYAMDLRGGDTIGASVSGVGTRLVVRDPSGRVVMGSEQDASFLFAPNSPLPGGGNALATHVAATAGRYSLEVEGGAGRYDITLEAYRPGSEKAGKNVQQTLFLDLDGARVNTAIWGGPGIRTLSALQGFLGRWGLSNADEPALINAIVASVTESLKADAIERGANPNFAVRIRNSKNHADTFGEPNVFRVIVGGTVEQSGISTIGIAQFIDPGNYGLEDSAVVLLDIMSNPAASSTASLNRYITPASDKIAFIGRAIGNVVAHEAGHLLGNYHTDTFNTVPNLMDAGGNFPGLFGVGPDNIGGTADDVDYDFGEDTLFPSEGFEGIEDTLNVSAWALTKGK